MHIRCCYFLRLISKLYFSLIVVIGAVNSHISQLRIQEEEKKEKAGDLKAHEQLYLQLEKKVDEEAEDHEAGNSHCNAYSLLFCCYD